jgi:AcrR family transcriptional regulator
MDPAVTLRDHARSAVRDEVSRHAWALFATHGFEATTVDQIAEAAGMSRRTFFRYFAGKDALVLERLVESGELLAATVQARPAGESAWTALRASFQVTVDLLETHADTARPLQIMLREEPALRATAETRRRLWIERLSPLTAERLPTSPGGDVGVRAVAVTGSALACLDAAQAAWAEHPGASLTELLDATMGAVAPL